MTAKVKEFLRVQLSAFIGGLSDFGIYTFCYTVLKFTAPFSNVISGSLGAIVNLPSTVTGLLTARLNRSAANSGSLSLWSSEASA